MHKKFLLVFFLVLSACANNSDYMPTGYSPDLNAAAVAARQTADVAQARSNALSIQTTAVAQRATDIAQGTRDAEAYRATTIAQDATGTAVVADSVATAEARSVIQTATVRAAEQMVSATAQAFQRDTTATEVAYERAGTATAYAYRSTEVFLQAQASATSIAVTATRRSDFATGTSEAILASATATRVANQAREEDQQTYWRNFFAPAAQFTWTILLPLGLFLLMLALLNFYMERNRVIQRGNTIIMITPGGVSFKEWKLKPAQYKIINQPVPQLSAPVPSATSGDAISKPAPVEELEDMPPSAPYIPPTADAMEPRAARELKTMSTNEANERYKTALEMLDATLIQLSKQDADGEKLNGKPFSYDRCHAAGFVNSWEDWHKILELWDFSGISANASRKHGWEIKVKSLKEGDSRLMEHYALTGYIRTNGVWMKR